MPFFSVIIPAYNAAAFIDRPLASLKAQRERDFEVLVIDDGSQDETLGRLRRWQEWLPGLRVHSQANAGPSAARNAGLERARGDYVLFLDADDELMPDALAEFRACCGAKPELDLVYAGYLTCKSDGSEKMRRPSPVPASRQALFAAYLRRQVIGVGNDRCVLRREALDGLRFPEGIRNNEDLVLYGQALARMTVGSIPGPVARIHHHAGSLRHDGRSAMEALAKVSALLFDPEHLAPEFMVHRAEFESGRLMALGGRLAAQGLHVQAMACYRRAWRVSPRAWLNWKALRRIMRSLGRSDR